MISQLKVGLVVGATIVGAIPPAVILVKGWDSIDPITSRAYGVTAGLSTTTPKTPSPAFVAATNATLAPAVKAPAEADRLAATFDLVAQLPAPADAQSPDPARPAPWRTDTPTAASPVAGSTAPQTPIRVATLRIDASPTQPLPLLPSVSTQPDMLPIAASDAAPAEQVASLDMPPVDTGKVPPPPPASPRRSIANDSAKADLRSMIESEAEADHVPAKLALAVVEVESGFDARKRGEDGKTGLFQIRPKIARALGFKGTDEELASPAVNIKWGMKYLAGAYKRADGDTCKTGMKFLGGHYQESFKPAHAAYCKKLEDRMAALDQ